MQNLIDSKSFPLVILLTHRRGAVLALIKRAEMLSNLEADYKFRILGPTAENLLHFYKKLLAEASLAPQDIKSLVVGAGPGSFTGLRLGCAFANGIKIAQNCALFAIQTELLSHFLSDNYFTDPQELKAFIEQLGDYNLADNSSGFVTFFDLLSAIDKIRNDKIKLVNELIPNYGKEPTPMLKLRGALQICQLQQSK